MAMHDWNHDGKKDMVDNFIEYQIYNTYQWQKQEEGRLDGIPNEGCCAPAKA